MSVYDEPAIIKLAEEVSRKTERAMARVMLDHHTTFGDWPARLIAETTISDDFKVTIKVYAASPTTPLEPAVWPVLRQVFAGPAIDSAELLQMITEVLAKEDPDGSG